MFLIGMCASAAGIGGGGLNVPALMIISGFRIKEAVPLSHSAVFGNACAQLLMNSRQRHPNAPQQPLIYYEAAFLVLPAFVGGNSFGVVFDRSFPPTLLVGLSVLLLMIAVYFTCKKGIALARDRSKICLLSASFQNEDEAAVHTPWKVITYMILFTIIFCVDFICLSKDIFGTVKCSWFYWLVLCILYPAVIIFIFIGISQLDKVSKLQLESGGASSSCDLEVNTSMKFGLPAAAMVIGLVAGLIGIGGGEFLVPLFLQFRLPPRVAAATSGLLIFFSTASDVIHYFIAGTLEAYTWYALSMFLFAFIGALIGLKIRDTQYVRKNNYLVVFLLVFLLIISAMCLGYRGFFQSPPNWAFSSFCPEQVQNSH